jgi:hypothetical protein
MENIDIGMGKKDIFIAFTLFILFLLFTPLFLKTGQATENQSIEFNIIGFGDISGYAEETYVIIETEAEWAEMWKKHTITYGPSPSPEIDFSKHSVICAFMGRRSTTGYSISIERIWANGEKIHVEIIKSDPPKDFLVSYMLTHPFVFASIEKTSLDFVFEITEEDGTITEYVLPEFTPTIIVTMVFTALSAIMLALTRKAKDFQLKN